MTIIIKSIFQAGLLWSMMVTVESLANQGVLDDDDCGYSEATTTVVNTIYLNMMIMPLERVYNIDKRLIRVVVILTVADFKLTVHFTVAGRRGRCSLKLSS